MTRTASLAIAALLSSGALSAQAPPAPPNILQFEALSAGGYLGVGVSDVNAERVKALKLKEERGAEITRVESDSPAAKAGLKAGDVVLEYNGQRIEGAQQFARMVRETPEGRQVRLLISRDGSTQTVSAVIGARKTVYGMSKEDQERLNEQMKKLQQLQQQLGDIKIRIPDVPQVFMGIRSTGLGIEAESLNPQLAEFFGVKEGVLVRMVLKDTPAQKAGLKAGDIITKVDDTSVNQPQDITRKLRSLGEKKTFSLTLVRDRKELTLPISVTGYETPK